MTPKDKPTVTDSTASDEHGPRNVEELEDALSLPTPGVVETMRQLTGDIIVLGVGGKMGPSLARMARRASDAASVKRRVIGVARFSSADLPDQLAAWGIEPRRADLLDDAALAGLPDAPNVVYMVGMKFGSTGNEPLTWAMNVALPVGVCRRYRGSKIVVFSTGNVYGLTPVIDGGSQESDAPDPRGEYAMSCLGRERIFEHFGRSLNIPLALIRLNYAVELRYGVLVDLARLVRDGEEINLSMGAVNVIWQRDANAMALRAFDRAAVPPFVLNVAGPETLSVRRVCEAFGKRFGKSARFVGSESPDALLNNGQLGHRLFGYPAVGVGQMMRWIADWMARNGTTLGKPTHFAARDGKF